MKKNGFTLAEVLITLAIIGVVATMTLPALMNNTQEQQAITGLKKGINTLTEAAQLSMAVDGIGYADIKSESTDNREIEVEQSLYAILANRTSMDFQKSQAGAHPGSDNFAVFLRDGAVILYDPSTTVTNATNGEPQNDGLPLGFGIIYDTNGAKGPNALSNCLGLNSGATGDTSEIADCNDKSKRIIKDQFGVKLRGGYAVPNGAAARWAFTK